MSESVIRIGDKLHIITRRQFADDMRRHFAGEVTAIDGNLQEIRGHAFVFETGSNEFRKRPELRTRIFSIAQDGFIVTKLPADAILDSLHYRMVEKRLVVTDGVAFALDVNEFGGGR